MRVAVLTWTDRRAGGVESYLEHVLPPLHAAGSHVSLWCEASDPAGRAQIVLPDEIERRVLPASTMAALGALRAWNPHVVLGNGLADPLLERALNAVAPSVFVAHNYHGTCISGTKCWTFPAPRPCTRTFGAGCLAHYYPHRCGGLNPITMLRLYDVATERLRNVRAAGRVVTLSQHMRREYIAQGLPPDQVIAAPYGPPAPGSVPAAQPRDEGVFSVVSVSRLEPLKGVDLLLDAMPLVAGALGQRVSLRVLGEGSSASSLRARANAAQQRDARVSVTFEGWLPPDARDAVLARADLLASPAVWPEPFGMTGLEAAHLGVPTVAFDVGAVPEWLLDGETGRLARGTPPSSASLAAAIADAARDRAALQAMGVRARDFATTRSPTRHAEILSDVLRSVAGEKS
jgi:glycosyltransferase involved in cell wall biosynthesis